MKKKAAFYTLGCKVNYSETESLEALFEQSGYTIVGFEEQADLYVINTCTVTAYSDHKSRKAIRRARRLSPEAIVVATGCYAQGSPDQVRQMEQADLVIGNRKREELPAIIESLQRGTTLELVSPHSAGQDFELLPLAGRRGRTRGFLKIQEGCTQFCSFCIVPLVRGPLRSMPPHEVIERTRSLVDSGCCEIVLAGIHLGLYGADLEKVTLATLLKEMEKLDGLVRLRLSSLEPSDITPELVEQIVESDKICPHLHLPLQSGDGEILRLMNRPYEPVEYLYLAKWLKQEIPALSLSTDIMVGFPGETERHHARSMKMVKDIGFSRIHVFKYSARPGTVAADLPGQLPNDLKERRSKEMINLGEEMASAYRHQFIGTVQPVLVEKVIPRHYAEGFTPHYLRARIAIDIKGLHWRGKEIRAHLEEEAENHLTARQVPARRKNNLCIQG